MDFLEEINKNIDNFDLVVVFWFLDKILCDRNIIDKVKNNEEIQNTKLIKVFIIKIEVIIYERNLKNYTGSVDKKI